MGCDWCAGRAADLVFEGDISADINKNTGLLNIYVGDKKVASRSINYCPMCGNRINPLYAPVRFLEELKKHINDVDPGTNKWNDSVHRVCRAMNMEDWYARYESLPWDEGDEYDAFLADKLASQN